MTEQEAPEISTDLVPTGAGPTTVDLRQATTDSWTDVLDQVADLAIKIAQTDFVPVDYRGKPGQVAAAILHGRELGMAPMTALATTNPIKGKPTISAEGMRSLVLQAGHQIAVSESSSSRVVLRGRRTGEEEWTTVTWTQDDARRAGLANGHNWQKYPRQMLAARATAELCRLIFADVIHGLRAAEELMDEVDQITPPQADEPAAAKTTTVRRRAGKKTPAAKKAEPAEPQEEKPPARKRAPIPPKKNTVPEPRPRPTPPPGGETDDTPTSTGESSAEEPPLSPQPVPDRPDTDETPTSSQDDSEVQTGRETGPKLSHGQRATVIMHFTRLGVEDRDERLWWTNHFLELDPDTVTSTNELRQAEAIKLISRLERFKDRDQLDASLQQDELIPNND